MNNMNNEKTMFSKDGLKAFAMLMAVANVKRMTDGKDKEKDEKGVPAA